MPKIDPQAFDVLGQMIRPPPEVKRTVVKEWMPDLNPAQKKIFFTKKRHVLAWGEKYSGKCAHGDALTYVDGGLKRLRNLKPDGARSGMNDISRDVMAFDGRNVIAAKATGFWVEDSREALNGRLSNGAEITTSPRHPLWVCAQAPDGAHEFRYAKMAEMEILKREGWRFWTPFLGHSKWDCKDLKAVKVEAKFTECRICGGALVARGLCSVHYHGCFTKQKGDFHFRGERCITITEDIAYLIGSLVGDGSLNINNDHQSVGFTNMDEECLVRVRRALDSIGCFLKKSYPDRHDHSIQPAKNIKPLIRALDIAKLSYFKRIPDVIMESPKSVAAAFLRGLFDTDGTVGKNRDVILTTTSEFLGKDVQDLLSAFGILASRRPRKSPSGNPTWNVSVCGRHALAFKHSIGFEIKRKMERIVTPAVSFTRPVGYGGRLFGFPDPIKKTMRQAWREAKIPKTRAEVYRLKRFCSFGSVPNRHKVNEAMELFKAHHLFTDFLLSDVWLEVEEISPCEAELFDLCVPGPHSFLASGIINHNTHACIERVMKHAYENDNAFVIILTRTGNMSTDGGAWHKLMTDVLPKWQDGLGIKIQTGVDKQHNQFVWVTNVRGKWCMILNTSAPNPEQLAERFRGREPSMVFVDELTSCSTDQYFKAIAAQLGRRPGVPRDEQIYLAATNPDDPEHWVYQMWFGDDGEGAGPEFEQIYCPKEENFRHVGEEYFKSLESVYRNDAAGTAWMITGAWVARPSGEGLFRDIYQTAIHVRPLNQEGNAHQQEILRPNPDYPMIIGLDPGSAYNAFSFQQCVPMASAQAIKQTWVIFDEIVTTKKRIPYEQFIPMVMRRIRWWRDEVGREMPMVWISDNSAFNQYRAASGSFDVLEMERIYEANRAKYKLEPLKIKPCPKFNGSVPARTRIAQKLLGDQEVIISSGCSRTQKMFLGIESKRQRPGDPIDPDAMLTPQRSDHLHIFDAVTYPWLAASMSATAVLPSNGPSQSLIQSAA